MNNIFYKLLQFLNIMVFFTLKSCRIGNMAGDYKKLLNKKRKSYANTKTMGVNIDKNEFYEIILSNSAFPDKSTKGKNK